MDILESMIPPCGRVQTQLLEHDTRWFKSIKSHGKKTAVKDTLALHLLVSFIVNSFMYTGVYKPYRTCPACINTVVKTFFCCYKKPEKRSNISKTRN